jgi:hypothetical protein
MSKPIEELFREKEPADITSDFPQEAVDVLREITERNDTMGSKYNHNRVSLARTVEWFQDEMGVTITERQIQTLCRKRLGRRSWARAK